MMNMSEPPVLSSYFSKEKKNEVKELTTNIDSLDIQDGNSKEPSVCRLFATVTPPLKDPTASFFDLLGSSGSTTGTGMIMDMDISTTLEDDFARQVPSCTTNERRRDSWIPSERTKQCLIACATAPAGTYFPDRDQLTMPGVLLEEDLGDAVGDAMVLCLGEAEASQRRTLGCNDVTQDERGLRELIQAGAYRAGINLTARLLNIYGQGRGRAAHPTKHSPHSLQLWFTRIALLVKTKQYNLAETEADQFGDLDKPDLYYQFYPEMYGGRTGSIATFSFRLLLAELPMHCGKTKDSLTKLFKLLSIVKQMIENLKEDLCEDGNPAEINSIDRTDSLKLWVCRETRIMHSIINCALMLKDFALAIDLLQQLCYRENSSQDALFSALGRLYLQLGDVTSAESSFNKSRELASSSHTFRELVDKGLISVAQNSFNESFTYFEQASQLHPNNVMVLNNMGVCLLYLGQLKEAVTVLESAIALNPIQGLHESLLLNLCTLYDMESSKGRMKKFALLRQISRYQADAPTTILEKLYG